jgi:hypothetical protein
MDGVFTLLAAASTTVDAMNYSLDHVDRAKTFLSRRAIGDYFIVHLTVTNDGRSAGNMSALFRLRCPSGIYNASNVTDYLRNESPFVPLNPVEPEAHAGFRCTPGGENGGLQRHHRESNPPPLETTFARLSAVFRPCF